MVALVPRCTEVRALPLGGKQPAAVPYPTRVAWRDGRTPSGWVSLAAIVALWTSILMRGQDRTYTHGSAAAGRPGSAQGAAFWAVVALVARCTEVRALPLGGKQPVAAPYPTRVAWRDDRTPSGWVSLAAIVALWTSILMRGQDRTYTHGSSAAGRLGSAQGAAFWALVALVPRCTEVRALPLGGKQPAAVPYPTRVAWRDGRTPSGWVSLAAIVALWTFFQDARTGQDLHPRERRSRTSRQRTGSSLLGGGGAGAEVY